MTHNERVLHVIAHSRISELRRRGHTIETDRDGDLFKYRLVSGPTALPADGRGVRPGEHGDRRLADQHGHTSAGDSPDGRLSVEPRSPSGSSPAVQLTLEAVA